MKKNCGGETPEAVPLSRDATRPRSEDRATTLKNAEIVKWRRAQDSNLQIFIILEDV
jgi:hypothetical protein